MTKYAANRRFTYDAENKQVKLETLKWRRDLHYAHILDGIVRTWHN